MRPSPSSDSLARYESRVSQDYWDHDYETHDLGSLPAEDAVHAWLRKVVKPSDGRCLELGAYPGRYLLCLGRMGYEVSGIDLNNKVISDLPVYLKKSGVKIGRFYCDDALTVELPQTYDLVVSFGLVEHFDDVEGVLERHARFVKPGGSVVITMPNFRGTWQLFLHQWLDAGNLRRHNLEAMDLSRLSAALESHGFKINCADYFGNVDFWVDPQPRTLFQRICLRCIMVLKPWLKGFPDRACWSPYLGLKATRDA